MSAKLKRDAVVYGRRYTAETAKDDGLVDLVSTAECLLDDAMRLGLKALGSNDIDRKSLQTMKQDMHPRIEVENKDSSKAFDRAKL